MLTEADSDMFKQLESTTFLKTKKIRSDELPPDVPRMIKLPKGVKPEYVKLTPFQEFSWRTMGPFIKRKVKATQDLEESLLKAHMRIRPDEYLATALMTVILVYVATIIAGIFLGGLIMTVAFVPGLIIMILLCVLPGTLAFMVLMGKGGFKGIPAGRAKTRATKINAKITSAMSFISAMASADVPVDIIFKELARQPVYGEIKAEAEWITRDTELLGLDILTALKRGSQRTPSVKFQEFLQGVVTTTSSGGQLKPYFIVKADQFEKEDKLDMRKKMETLGLLAETFVTVVVAFPLFLVVIIAIMVLISKGSSSGTLMMLWAIVGLMIPICQFAFIFLIWNMGQEA